MNIENEIREIIGNKKFHFNKLTGYYHLGTDLKTDRFLFQYRPGDMVLHVSLYEVVFVFKGHVSCEFEEVLLPIMNKIFDKEFSQIVISRMPPIAELKLRKLRQYCNDNIFDKKIILPKYFNIIARSSLRLRGGEFTYSNCEFNYEPCNIDVERREDCNSYH